MKKRKKGERENERKRGKRKASREGGERGIQASTGKPRRGHNLGLGNPIRPSHSPRRSRAHINRFAPVSIAAGSARIGFNSPTHPRIPTLPTSYATASSGCHGRRGAEGAAQRAPQLHVRLGHGGRAVPAAADAAGRREHAGLRRRGRHPLLRRRRQDHLRARQAAGAAHRGLR